MKKHIFRILLSIALSIIPMASYAAFGDTSSYIGQPKYGDGKDKLDAYFDFPQGIYSDGEGNFYIADTFNNAIRKIAADGIVSTVAGQGSFGDVNSTGADSRFGHPTDVTVDDSGNVYIVDSANGKIKKFNGTRVSTIIDGLERPEGIFLRNNTLYFTDYEAGKLLSANKDGSNLKVITSNLEGPKKLYVRTDNTYAYVVDTDDYTIVRVKLDGGHKTVVGGISGSSGKNNGSCSEARFANLWGISVVEGSSLDEDDIYVTDATGDPGNEENPDTYIQNSADNGKVRVIDLNGSDVPEGSQEESIADAVFNAAVPNDANCEVYLLISHSDDLAVNYPRAITRYGEHMYVLVTGISKILKVKIGDGTDVTKFAGKDRFQSEEGVNGLPGRPKDLAITDDRQKIYFSENNQISMIVANRKRVKHIVGHRVDNYQRHDEKSWKGEDGRFSDPLAIALSPNEKKLYVVDRNNNRIREVNIKDKSVSYLTGAGGVNAAGGADNGYKEGGACPSQFDFNIRGCAYFTRPAGIAVNKKGNYAYVADTGNHVIRRVKLTGTNKGKTKLIAGRAGQTGFVNDTGSNARFNVPISLTISSNNKFLYVADRNNHAIRKIRLRDNKVTTVTGKPTRVGYLDGRLEDAYLNLPVEVYYNKGNIFFTESGTHRVRVVDMEDQAVKLVSGDGNRGYINGDKDNAQYDQPVGIVRKGKKLLVSDSQNDVIRKISLGNGVDIPYTDPGPGVTSVNPSSNRVAGNINDTKALEIRGGEFQHGAVAYFGSHQANATYVNSDTTISVVIPFGHMEPGYYQVKVENIDGQIGCAQRAYSISDSSGNVPVVDHWAGCD